MSTRLPSLPEVALGSLRQRPARAAATLAGVTLGVAAFVGLAVSNVTVTRALTAQLDRELGRADVVAYATAKPLPPSAVPAVGNGVAEVAAASYVQVTSSISAAHDFTFTITGVDRPDVLGLRALRGRMPRAGEQAVALTPGLASTLGARLGQHIVLHDHWAPAATVSVVGIVDPHGANRTGAVGSAQLAQTLTGGQTLFEEVDVRMAPGVGIGAWVKTHRGDFGPDASLIDRAAARANWGGIVSSEKAFGALALLALVLGGYLIYLTMDAAVLERRPALGVLRAVGASPAQIRQLVLSEAAIFGAVGSIAGVALGMGLAAAVATVFAQTYRLRLAGFAVPPVTLAVGLAAGMVTSVVAASLPARQAARVEPLSVMRADPPPPMPSVRTAVIGLAFLVVGLGGAYGAPTETLRADSVALVLLAGLVVTPLLRVPLAWLAGRAARRLSPSTGRIAAMHFTGEKHRPVKIVGLIVIVLAVGFAVDNALVDVRRAGMHELRTQFGADLQIEGNFIDPATLAKVRAIPGVRVATPIQLGTPATVVHGHPDYRAGVAAIDAASYFPALGFDLTDGNPQTLPTLLAQPGTVLLPANIPAAVDVKAGRPIVLDTRDGPRTFRVAGHYATLVTFGYGSSLVVGSPDAAALHAGPAYNLDILADPHTDLARVKQQVTATLNRADFTILTQPQMAGQVISSFRRITGLYYAVLAVAMLIGMLGLANTLGAAVMERRREIGMLRAVGANRRSIRSAMLAEALLMTATGWTLSLPLGLLLADLTLRSLRRTYGAAAHFHIDPIHIAAFSLIAAIVAVVASALPARNAAKLDPITAIAIL